MLATITKHQESAALAILCDEYVARGGKIHRDLTPAQKRKRRALGMAAFNPVEWERNARAQQLADDEAYYHMSEAKHSRPMYDPVLDHLYGMADNDRRQSKGAADGGTELK